jgi:hypothetical protein
MKQLSQAVPQPVSTYRLIPSRFPPVELYEPICQPSDWDGVKRVEGMTNPRLREMATGLGLLHPDDRGRVSQNWLVAPFTYPDPEPSPFSDGSYGYSLVAETIAGALLEAVRRREAFLSRTEQGPARVEMRMLKTPLQAELLEEYDQFQLEDWSETHSRVRALRDSGSYGFWLPKRENLGRLAVVLRPTAFGTAVQAEHYAFIWNGKAIEVIYDFSKGETLDPSRLKVLASARAA